MKNIKSIHESLLNGQRKQMVEQIDEYGTYDFWADYVEWLKTHSFQPFAFLSDAVTSYHRIKGR